MSSVTSDVIVGLVGMVMVFHIIACVVQTERAEYDVATFQRDIPTPERDVQLASCYRRLMSPPRKQGIRVLHLDRQDISEYLADTQSPVVVWNLRGDLVKISNVKWDNYINLWVAESFKDIIELINIPTLIASFNSRAKYIIVYLGVDSANKIFHWVWQAYIVNVIVIRPNDTSIYTYFPYGAGECGTNIRSVVLGKCLEIPLDKPSLFPAKASLVYNGCEIRPSTQIKNSIAYSQSEDARLVGLPNAIMNAIYKKFYLPKRPITAAILRNMSVPEIQIMAPGLDVEKGQSDLTIIMLTRKSNYTDFSHVFFQSDSMWTVPIAGRDPQWKAAINNFDEPVWYFVMGMFCLNIVVWWLECVFGSWLVLMNSAVAFPRTTALRFVVCAWSVFCLIIIAAYQGLLLGFLLAPLYESQISTQQELVNSDLNITATYGVLRTLNNSSSQLENK